MPDFYATYYFVLSEQIPLYIFYKIRKAVKKSVFGYSNTKKRQEKFRWPLSSRGDGKAFLRLPLPNVCKYVQKVSEHHTFISGLFDREAQFGTMSTSCHA